ncbi:MAG: BMP family ABC transporter substrate-binding protein, partial [Actinomycetota bacterium]
MRKHKGLKSAALALAAFALIASACGSDDAAEEVTEDTEAAEEVTEETAAPLPGAGTLACMVTDTGGVDDKGFNQISYEGMKKAESELGVTIDLLESSSDADYAPNLQSFADKGCNITVTVGFLLGDATKAAAEANAGLNYAIVDFAYDPPVANARGLVFATDQPSFMAGYLSAAMSTTGIVGTYGGINIPPVTVFMEGFRKGVEDYNAQNGSLSSCLVGTAKTEHSRATLKASTTARTLPRVKLTKVRTSSSQLRDQWVSALRSL